MPPFYGCQPADGLHVLKDKWTKKTYLGQQSQKLADQLDQAIQATFDAAPGLRRDFRLDKPARDGIHESEEERRLENAMWKRWNNQGMSPAPGWFRIVAYQIPLFDRKKKNGWGYIDLLGVSPAGTPVVIELKRSPKSAANGITKQSETPLRMVLEAASYGLALIKNWERFRPAWTTRLENLGVPQTVINKVPKTLKQVSLVGVAPAAFWIDWLPVTSRGASELTTQDWDLFGNLLGKFREHNLSVSFVSLSGDYHRPESLAAQRLIRFP